MTNERSANSSDLDLAREMSRKLRPGPPPSGAAPEAKAGEGDFIRFRATEVLGAGGRSGADAEPPLPVSTLPLPAAPGSLPPAAPSGGASPFSGSLWGPLLDGCRSAARAESAFVLDAQGLIVAARGPVPASVAEEMGSRLMVALEHARKMPIEGAAEASVAFEFGGRHLSGFSLTLRDATEVTLALIGPEVVDGPLRLSFERIFRSQV